MSGRPQIAICIVTYLRPVGLARVLDRIADLDLADLDGTLRVVVVDNDGTGSAAPVVERARQTHGLDITDVVEPTRGITFARNRALAIVRDLGVVRHDDWIVWIDDDEAPRPDWLQRVLATQRTTGADVVTGPSHPIYGDDAPTWIVDAGVFESRRFVTGEPYPFFYTRTSGVLMRASTVPDEGFDDRLALTGGEDRVFFTRIHRAGHSFVWDDEAVVDEWLPASRVRVGWLLRRWFRTGVTRSLTLVYLDDPSPIRRLRRVAGGLRMSAQGLVETGLAAPRGRAPALAAAHRIMIGLGASYGAFGLHFREYRRIHGR